MVVRPPMAGRLMAPALIAVATLSSALWIVRDRRVWPWDQAWYGEAALDLWEAGRRGVGPWLAAMVDALGSKPPLLVWAGQFFVPLSSLTGAVESALLLLNAAAAAATLGLVYVVSRRMGAARTPGLAGVALCGGASLFIGLTHQFLVETVQVLTAAATILVAQRAARWPLVRTLCLAALVAALSLLAKVSSVTFLAPLLLYAGVAATVTAGRRRPTVTAGDLPIAALSLAGVAGAVAWYAVNWRPMVQHAITATTGDIALYYGSSAGFAAKLVLWTGALVTAVSPLSALTLAILTLIVVALAVALARVPVAPVRGWIARAVESGALLGLVLAATAAATLMAYSLQTSEETRFLAPLVPILAVLTAWSLIVLGRRPLDVACLAVLVANGIIGHAYAHGHDPLRIRPSPWLMVVNPSPRDAWLLTRAVQATCRPASADRYVVIGVEYPALNPPSASFYSVKERRTTGFRCLYASLGYAESDPERALAHISRLGPAYVVTVPPDKMPAPDPFNRVSAPVARHLATDPRFELSPDSDADLLIYQRRTR